MGLDDDDLDLFGPSKGSQELSSLLADIREEKREDPTPTAEAPAAIRSLAENERKTVETERATLEAPDGYHDLYGLPGTMPWEKMAYAYRVLSIRTRAVERAVFVAREIDDASRALPDAEAELGRALHDAAGPNRIELPNAALAEIKVAMEALSSLSATRDEIRRNAERQGAMASARRESAAATLDPVSAEQTRALTMLESAERRLEQAKGAVATAEMRLADAAANGSSDVPALREAVEAAHRDHAAAARATRDAALSYAEVRRRAVLQMGRFAEADREVEGARVEEKRAVKMLARREDEALRSLGAAYTKLGAIAYETSLGREYVTAAFAGVKSARDRITTLGATVETLRQLANGYDRGAARDGRTGFVALAAIVVALLVSIAAIS